MQPIPEWLSDCLIPTKKGVCVLAFSQKLIHHSNDWMKLVLLLQIAFWLALATAYDGKMKVQQDVAYPNTLEPEGVHITEMFR